MSDNKLNERRQFSRIPFHAQAHLLAEKGEMHLNCDVLDVSLKGILVNKPEGWQGQYDDKFQVDLLLENGELVIKMLTAVAHVDDHSIGFICEHIDLDSITHLKRLVELNLGDPDLLHRELSSLIH